MSKTTRIMSPVGAGIHIALFERRQYRRRFRRSKADRVLPLWMVPRTSEAVNGGRVSVKRVIDQVGRQRPRRSRGRGVADVGFCVRVESERPGGYNAGMADGDGALGRVEQLRQPGDERADLASAPGRLFESRMRALVNFAVENVPAVDGQAMPHLMIELVAIDALPVNRISTVDRQKEILRPTEAVASARIRVSCSISTSTDRKIIAPDRLVMHSIA